MYKLAKTQNYKYVYKYKCTLVTVIKLVRLQSPVIRHHMVQSVCSNTVMPQSADRTNKAIPWDGSSRFLYMYMMSHVISL